MKGGPNVFGKTETQQISQTKVTKLRYLLNQVSQMESLIRSSLIGTRPGIYENKKKLAFKQNCHVEQRNFFKAQNNALS